MLTKALCSTLLFCLLLPLSAQDAPKEQPYRMGHTHGYFPYDKDSCNDSKSDCSQTALAAFLDSVWQHPHPAPGEPARGKVTVSFIVEKDGSLSEMKVFEDPQNGLKEAAIAALERMNELEIRWVPGEYKEKVVRSQQSLKFPFQRSDSKVSKTPEESSPQQSERDVFKVVERMPMFSGCEGETDNSSKQLCAQKKLLEYVYGNLRYNATAKANGREGMAVISFIVEADGRVTNPKIVRDPGDGLGQDALDVIEMMQSDNILWEPGIQGGVPRAVQFNLPVKFKLD